jgi:lamin tail-like protein
LSRTRRFVLTALTSVPLALGALVALQPPAQAADTDIKINEVESQDGFPDDWVELFNTGAAAVDISGWVVKDSTNNVRGTVAAATTLAPGAYYVVEAGSFGDSDQARLFLPDTTTQVGATYTWTTPAHGTYSRCANGTGAFVDVTPSKNAANVCGSEAAWPGGTNVAVADTVNAFTLQVGNIGDDVSGLAYQGSGSSAPGTLWAVQNSHGTLYKLIKSGGVWAPDATFGTNGAKALHFPGGAGEPDTEGLTLTDAGPAGGFFASTERDATTPAASRPSILQFQDAAGGSLDATHEWNLAADLPVLDANMALEGIAWVPDSYLTAHGFKDQSTNATYNPASYANHGTGLFFVGVEQTGDVYAYALDLTSSSYTRVAKFASGFPSVMDLTYEPGTQKLWVACDDTCGGRTAQFQVNGAGAFTAVARFERPAAAANLNNEGFAIAPQSECVGGTKPTFYADDSNDGGHVLRVGTLSCSLVPTITAAAGSSKAKTATGWYGAPVTVTFTCAPGPLPLAGPCPTAVTLSTSGANQTVTRSVSDTGGGSATATVSAINVDLVAPTVTITGVKKGKTYPKKKKPKCAGTDALSGVASCTITQKKKGSKYVVVATATDNAGNLTTTTLTYKVKKKKKS